MLISFQPSGQQKHSQRGVAEDEIDTEWNPTTLGPEGTGITLGSGREERGKQKTRGSHETFSRHRKLHLRTKRDKTSRA